LISKRPLSPSSQLREKSVIENQKLLDHSFEGAYDNFKEFYERKQQYIVYEEYERGLISALTNICNECLEEEIYDVCGYELIHFNDIQSQV